MTQKLLTGFLGLKASAEGRRLSGYGRRFQLESHPLLSSTTYELQGSSVLAPAATAAMCVCHMPYAYARSLDAHSTDIGPGVHSKT